MAIHNFTGAKPMRNLTIASTHTYYVIDGNVPVLVHNDGGLTPDEQAMADKANAICRANEFDQIRAAYAGGTLAVTIGRSSRARVRGCWTGPHHGYRRRLRLGR